MFYSNQILARKGPLGLVWIAAHLDRQLKRQQINSTSIPASVDTLLDSEVPLALRLSGQLLLGVVRIYARKVGLQMGMGDSDHRHLQRSMLMLIQQHLYGSSRMVGSGYHCQHPSSNLLAVTGMRCTASAHACTSDHRQRIPHADRCSPAEAI